MALGSRRLRDACRDPSSWPELGLQCAAFWREARWQHFMCWLGTRASGLQTLDYGRAAVDSSSSGLDPGRGRSAWPEMSVVHACWSYLRWLLQQPSVHAMVVNGSEWVRIWQPLLFCIFITDCPGLNWSIATKEFMNA